MTTGGAPLLELQRVTHSFGATVALDDASIAVRAGTVHALLGENGAGKTTLMRVAFGLVKPDAGAIAVDGEAVTLHGPGDAIAHGIGMVHQHFTLVPAMTVAENMALGGRGRFDRAGTARDLAALAAASGLRLDADARAETLNVAQQQRLEIIKALHRDARVLILDEPTAVLAPAEADELLRWLRGYVARGNAAVLITHKLREALAVADEVTVLRRGRVAAHLGAGEATEGSLAAAMLGESGGGESGSDPSPGERGAVAVDPSLGEPVTDDYRPYRGPRATNETGNSAATTVVCARAISGTHGRERIVDASFTIAAGEVVGVAGVEGAGHHLLLRMLARRVVPRSGMLELPTEIGFVPEDRHRDSMIGEFTLAENAALRGAGARGGRMTWRHWRERATALVSTHDVRGVAQDSPAGDVHMGALSGGNQQRFVIGRELDGEPALVVAENPTRGLDIRAAADVRRRLRAAAANGAAVVVYSADLDEVIAIADRVLVVHAGRVTACPRDRDAVGRAMLGTG